MLARQRDDAEAAVLQRSVQPAHAFAGGAEADRGLGFMEAQQVDHRVLDLRGAYGDRLVGDVAMAAGLADEAEAQRVALVAFGKTRDRARHCRGEQQRAARLGSRVEDLLEVLAKAHVEHLVGFVEDDTGEFGQIERTALEMVAQSSGGPDDDRRPRAQRTAFLARIHPADAGGDAQSRTGIEPAKLAADLQRQFARRGDDQHQRAFGQRRAADRIEQFGRQRETEGDGLAAAGLGGNDQIATCRFGFGNGLLDRGKRVVATSAKGLADNRREVGKGHDCLSVAHMRGWGDPAGRGGSHPQSRLPLHAFVAFGAHFLGLRSKPRNSALHVPFVTMQCHR